MSCTAPGRLVTDTTRLVQSWPEALGAGGGRGWVTMAKRVRLWASSWIAGATTCRPNSLAGALAGDGRPAPGPGRPGARLRRCWPPARRSACGQVVAQPAVALRQRLRVGAARPRCRPASRSLRSRLWRTNRLVSPMMNSGVVQEQVERARHHAFGGVLHRHHAEVGRAGGGGAEHLVDAGAGHAHDRRAEEAQRRLFAEGAGRAEVGHARGRFQRAAGRHDLAPDRRHAVGLQRAGVGGLQAVDHLRLALGAEHHRAFVLLDLADLQRQAGAAVQQRQQLAVDGVDLLAQRQQVRVAARGGSQPWRSSTR